jgi:uncharacterized protein YdaU (DUF1376 family)
MKADTWMAFYVGDYVTDTMHLTTRQHGAYLLLIIAAWKGGGWIAGSDAALMAITRLSPKEWQQDASALLPFFVKDGDRLRHNRVAFEWNEAQRRTADKSRAGRAGASKRWHGDANSSAMATPMPEQSQVDAQLQIQIPVTTTDQVERGAFAPCAKEGASDGRRGTRLSADWQPSSDERGFAADLGIDPDATADAFRDYWVAVPGAKGRKLDWPATWRGWCRRETARPMGKGSVGQLQPTRGNDAFYQQLADIARRADD